MVTPSRLFLVYLVVEAAALAALIATIGFGWTLLLIIGSFVAGLLLAGSQLRAQLRRLLGGRRGGAFGGGALADGALADGALVAVGTLLVVVPGLVSTVAGLLVLLPPTRSVVRRVAGARRSGPYRRAARADVIDGEVGDVIDTKITAGEVVVVSPAPTP